MKNKEKDKIKVLIIDDSQGILFVMRQALEIKNYQVETCDRFESVEKIKEISPDLIYLDISLLGGEDGRAISRQLKNNPDTKNIPIIILTGHNNADELAREAEADDYLSKPFGLMHLWEKTEKFVKKSH